MQNPEVSENIMETPAGNKLGIEESAAIEDAIGFMLAEASEDRDGEDVLSRDGLQTYVSKIMQQVGMEVELDVPLPAGGAGAPETVLDMVADWDGRKCIVQLEADIPDDTPDRLRRLLAQVKASYPDGRLYLTTDILNGNVLVLGPLSRAVRELMVQEGMGVILADKLLILICQNHDQLMLEEMPHFIFPKPQPG